MRVAGPWSLLLAAGFTSSLVHAQPAGPNPPPPSAPSEPPAPAPPPAAETTAAPSAPSPPAATSLALPDTEATPSDTGAKLAPTAEPPSHLTRDFHALPLTLEARLGVSARLGSTFDDATQEEHWGASYAFAAYLAWRPQFALGMELDHSGLGSVRAQSGQASTDNQYTATGAWLSARVFPIRRERLDLFVNLRVGMVWQHVDALGTREAASITEPAQSFACTAWDGPGLGLGGALGLAYRLGRHVAFVSRVDLSAARLSGESLGTCADGIGSVASLGGSVGLAFEFETVPK